MAAHLIKRPYLSKKIISQTFRQRLELATGGALSKGGCGQKLGVVWSQEL